MRAVRAFVNVIAVLTTPIWGGIGIVIIAIQDIRASDHTRKMFCQLFRGEKWFWTEL